MQLVFKHNNRKLEVLREVGDPVFYNDESRLLYHIKNELRRHGYDCIKKLAYKDGNLVDNSLHYIRDRRKNTWCIFDDMYQVRNLASDFTKTGIVTLTVQGVLAK